MFPAPLATLARRTAVVAGFAAMLVVLAAPALAVAAPGAADIWAAPAPQPKKLDQVITDAQTWIIGILAAVATLFLILAGVYYATAGGDPAQVDKAKSAFKNALIGYALAVLAPTLLEIVKGIVGG